ncbi:hypothetical protein GCM10009624_06330 [Gordonia sinesedis]
MIIDLAVAEIDTGAQGYTRMLDRAPTGEGAAVFDVGGVLLRLRPADTDHRVLFPHEDTDEAARVVQRRGLELTTSRGGEWLAADLPVGLYPSVGDSGVQPDDPGAGGAITGVDHVVFHTTDRDRAVALFGATLGLDFRLDRRVSDDLRQLFFRTTGPVIEVVVTPGDTDEPDSRADLSVWGIAWATVDIDRTRARLADAGVDVSEVRSGHKPGTRVMTVRDPALATRTILIESDQPRPPASSPTGTP